MFSRAIPIESIDDPRVAVFRDVRDADLRGRDKLFMAESEPVLRRLLRTPQRLHSLLVSPRKLKRLDAALQALPDHVPVYVAELEMMADLAGFIVHRGVLAAGHRLSAQELAPDAALNHLRGAARCRLLIAEGLTNVDNMGALFRNAAAFGMDGIVLDPTCCDPLYRKAIRVSMGHALSVPYAISCDWPGDLIRLKQRWQLTLIAVELANDAQPLWQLGVLVSARGGAFDRLAILLGSEGHGLSAAALASCDGVVEIPMNARDGASPSLNVAVASAVALYELTRSLGSAGPGGPIE
jgi:tRNA G18 (ribose-2'-O)-methylase SpoU